MKRLKMLGVGSFFGYTIIEVMIFLAVSGALFISASALISGRQERTMFQQSVNTMSQTLEDLLNDVSTGYYPSNSDFDCYKDASGKPYFGSGAKGQGQNEACIFSGKLISFNTTPPSSRYSIYTMVSANPELSLPGSSPSIGTVGTLLLGSPNPGIKEEKTNNVDLNVSKMFDETAPGTSYNNIAIVSDFGSISSTGTLSANASKTRLYWYTSTPTTSPRNANIAPNFSLVPSDHSVIICLEQANSSSDSKKAYITLTPQLTVSKITSSRQANCP